MNRPYDEQISALADGELPLGELELLLRRTQTDGSVGARIGRYALIRDALHRNLPAVVNEGLADRVAAALALEPAHTDRRPGRGLGDHRRWSKPAAGLAIAASVAMLAVLIWPTGQGVSETDGGSNLLQTASVDSSTATSSVQTVASENIRWDRLDPDVQARLNGYAITHGEQSAGRQVGIVPRHVRITGQGTGQ